jgi:hypothetical protein
MALTPRQDLIREVSEKIADILQDRERAITIEQYQTHSQWILEELRRIDQPADGWFKANQASTP